jgi:hypothetical protein
MALDRSKAPEFNIPSDFESGDREDSATEMMTADGHAARQGTGKGATVG